MRFNMFSYDFRPCRVFFSFATVLLFQITEEKASCSVVSNFLWPPWTIAHQASLSTVFPSREYWSRLPFPSSGGLPDSGIKPRSNLHYRQTLTIWATREALEITEIPPKFKHASILNHWAQASSPPWHPPSFSQAFNSSMILNLAYLSQWPEEP